jgi:TolA-binding protein
LNGEAFAVGDLVVGRAPESGSTVIANVEPHVDRELAAIVELYSTTPATLDQTKVTFEVADTEESPALVTTQAESVPGSQSSSRTMQGLIVARALPPGSYVARARITRDDKQIGLLMRPFVLHPATAGATPVLTRATVTFAAPAFDRAATLAPALIKELLDAAEKRAPTLKDAIAEARAGRYAAASLEALGGDQSIAAFLKGLDLYSKGQFDQAANQLNIAAGPRREFFPAAFYLGASFAAAGRDRDAASVWQLGIGTDPRPAITYSLFADARFRDGQPQSVIDVLEPAWRRSQTDDQVARRLAFAYIMTGRHADAIPLLDAYLTRNGDDQDALYAAIVAHYEASSRAGVSLSQAETAKITRYARAYRGPQQALLEKYLEALRAR